MKILYDGDIYTLQKTGGINRYFANLISRLPTTDTPTLTTCRRPQLNALTHPNLDLRYFPRPDIPRFRRIGFWVGRQYLRSVVDRQSFDLLHPTYYSLLHNQPIDHYSFPMVLTVHDFVHEHFEPDHPHIAAKRQAILCVSENTKKDLLERHPQIKAKITVTPLASEIDASLAYGNEPVPTPPYCLYVGSRFRYKNFDGMLTALAQVITRYPDLQLCVVGAPFSKSEQQVIATLGLSQNVQNYGYVDDRQLAKLYRCSLAFVYPSFYEGFGIPPLEAMACGTAVIAANTSSLPEVVGDAGILFDPHSTSALADSLLGLLDRSLERDRLIAKGTQRVKQFNWDKTAAQTFEVYRSVQCA
jgi:glycosyltransferase involved in cell wall biosynthesis